MVELPRGSYRLPESLLNVRGDGNCLPRSIALAITGRQQMTDDPNEPNPDHKRLRELVVNHLLRQGLDVTNIIDNGDWMTEQEINAYAQILGVPIYSCSESYPGSGIFNYQRFPYHSQLSDDSGAIYITNWPTRTHFQVVKKP